MATQLQTVPLERPAWCPTTGVGLRDAGGDLWRTEPAENVPAARDLHRMRRLVAVQNHLIDLMADQYDAGKLLTGVASLLELPVALFDSRGTVVAQAGDVRRLGDPQRLWGLYMEKGDSVDGPFEWADGCLCFHEVTMLGRVERVLAAAVPRFADLELVEMALAYLERLLALDAVRQREELLAARRVRGRLLQEFLAATAPSPGELAIRMEREGIDPGSPWRVVVCEVERPRSQRAGTGVHSLDAQMKDRMVAAAERIAAERRMPQLLTVRDSDLVMLATWAEGELAAVQEYLNALQTALQEATKMLPVHIGCSSEKVGLSGGARALHEAQEAAIIARRDPDGVEVFDEIRRRYRVIDGQSDETLRDIYERTVARLAETDAREHTRLLETLTALLGNELAVQTTADSLYIHRNTLQKRLHRIERLLDVDLDRLDDVVELYLGLRAAELLGRPN